MVTIVKKAFNDDLDDYLDKLHGKRERSVEVVRKPQKKQTHTGKMPDQVSEEEIFVEYDDARPSIGVGSWISGLFAKKSPDEKYLRDDIPVTEAKVLEEVEEEVEEINEEIEELEEKRDSLWSRFLKSMRSSRKSDEEMKEELLEKVIPALDADMKETLKMLHKWLEKLSPQEMRAFKASNDFLVYKNTLERYGLIKKP